MTHSPYLRRVTPLLAAWLALGSMGTFAQDSFQRAFQGRLEALWAHRAELGGVVRLMQVEEDLEGVADPDPVQPVLDRLVQAPDTHEELRAHALNLSARLKSQRGDWDGAEADRGRLGYLREWILLGPFPDDNKEGFDTPYPPEKDLAFQGSWEGKGHPVSWRRVPPLAGRHAVPMDGMLDPSKQVAGYAATFLRVEKDTPAVLRGGVNEAFKAWVDGEQVASRKEYSGRTFDQYSFPCHLRKGWNLILLKVCNQEAGWNFSLRITDGRGLALGGWQATSDPAAPGEPLAAILAKDGSPPPAFDFLDLEAALRKAAEEGAWPGAAGDYARFLFYKQPFDRSDQKDVRAIEAALEGAPDSVDLLLLLGDAHEDHNLARKAYQKALDKSPASPDALLRMAVYYTRRGMSFPALEHVGRGLAADPDNASLLALQWSIRLQFSVDGLAAREIADLARRYPRSEPVWKARVSAARTLGLEDEALALASAYRSSHQAEPDAWEREIRGLRRRGLADRADALHQEARLRFPFLLLLVSEEAARWLQAGQPEKGLGGVEGALAFAADWAEGHKIYGDLLSASGREEEGLAEYQRSLLLMPQQEDLKAKVAYLTPEKAGFEAGCRLAAGDVPSDTSLYKGEQAVVLLDNTAIEVQPSGLSSEYVQLVYQVLSPGAVEANQSFSITFDPDREEVKILEASVLKGDGRKVHAETFTTDRLSQPQYRLYYRNRNLVLNFPSLSAGDRVWIEYKRSDVGDANEYGQYFGHLELFAGTYPILLKQLTLVLPDSLPLSIHEEKMPSKPMVVGHEGMKTYRWVARDLPKFAPEPEMPGLTEIAPYLHASTFADWQAMGKWYASFIQDQWELTSDMKKLAADLVAGKESDQEKVEAIHRWVVTQTRYVGLEFGVHGYRPYKVRQIYERRFGDCKDKAILLAAMLREVGVDAAMALVRTRDLGPIHEEPASLAIFNHAICYVPSLDRFLDGTAEYSGVRELPYQDQGTWSLQVWPDGRTRRGLIPESAAEDNQFGARYRITLARGSQDAPFEGHLRFQGVECAWVRQRYQDPDKQASMLEQDLSGTYPGTAIAAGHFTDLSDINGPVEVTFSGTFGQIVRPDGDGRASVPIWLGRVDLSSRLASLVRRRWTLVNDFPWQQEYEVTYALPEGAVADLPSDMTLDNEFGTLSRVSVSRPGEVTVKTSVKVKVHRVETGSYGAFRDFCSQAESMSGQRVRILWSEK